MRNRSLFAEFLRVYAFQPATAFWRSIEVDILRKSLPRTGSVLDLGCGDGKFSVILFGENPPKDLTLVGVDYDQDETDQARKYPLYTRVHTSLAQTIPEPSESFDYVFANSVLEHIDNIDDTILEVSRILKPGGAFIFTVPSASFHKCLAGPLIPYMSRDAYMQKMDKRLMHYRYWDVDDWHEMLKCHGLLVEHHEEYLTLAEARRWETIHRFTGGFLSTLSGHRKRPLEVQKKSGLRQVQNRIRLPTWFTHIMARSLSAGINICSNKEETACLLISARKA